MTDVQKTEEMLNNEKIAEAKAQREALLKSNVEIKETFEKGNAEIKGVLEKLTSVLEKKETEVKAEDEQKALKKDNGEVKMGRIVVDEIKNFEKKIKSFSIKSMENLLDEKEASLMASDEFYNYAYEKAMNKTEGNQSKSRAMVEDLKQQYRELKGTAKGKIIPMFNETKSDNIMRESVGAEGGYLATPAMQARLQQVWNKNILTMRDVATVHNLGTAHQLTIPLEFEGVKTYWEGEETNTAEDSSPKYGKVEINTGTIIAKGKASRTIQEDTGISLYDRFITHVRNEVALEEEKAFFLGNGEHDKPKGLFSAHYGLIGKKDAFVKDKFRSYVYNAASAASYTSDLEKVVSAIQTCINMTKRTVLNKTLFMNNDLYDAISQMKSSTGVSLYTGMPEDRSGIVTLFGLPVITSEYIPSIFTEDGKQIAANGKGIFLGNMAEVYNITEKQGLVDWVDVLTDTIYYKFNTRKRVGGGAAGFNNGLFVVEE